MTGKWSAHSERELAGWSHAERESRVVFSRLEEWRGFGERAPYCIRCRCQNVHLDPRHSEIKVTPVGRLCLRCWLDWPACDVCGTGPVAVDYYTNGSGIVFRGKQICADCLVPEIPSAWDEWLRWFFATPKSSYQRVFEAYPLVRST